MRNHYSHLQGNLMESPEEEIILVRNISKFERWNLY